jgi:hypothetical protein
MKKYIILALTIISSFYNALASHNVGGFISAKHIAGFTYAIKVTTITNIGPTIQADRCTMEVNFSDGSSIQVDRVNGPTGTCSEGNKMGEVITPNLKLNYYTGIKTFSTEGNYTMWMSDPNRNEGIINIPNSVNVPFYVETTLSVLNPQLYCPNSTLDFGMMPAVVTSAGANYDGFLPLTFSEGDSVSYTVGECKWNGNPIPGYYTIPGITINPSSGKINFTAPSFVGSYSIAIIAKKWRKGIELSATLIDYQITVYPNPFTPFELQLAGNFTLNTDGIYEANFTTNDSIHFNYLQNSAIVVYRISSEIDSLSMPVSQAGSNYYGFRAHNFNERKKPYKLTLHTYQNQNLEYVAKDYQFSFTIGNIDHNNCTLPLDLGFTELNKSSFKIAPNPATNLLTINSNAYSTMPIQIHIIGYDGKIMKSIIQHQNTANFTLDISDLQQGFYFLKIESNTTSQTQKFIKL